MNRCGYSDEQLEFLRFAYPLRRLPELTRLFNRIFDCDRSKGQIKSALSNHRITCGRRRGWVKSERALILTDEQIRFVKTTYRKVSGKDLTTALNERFATSFTFGQVRAFLKNHGITSGRTGRFEKGLQPWNAGTKGVMKRNSGTFQKGNVPATIKPLGSERICSKDGYVLVKVAEPNPYTGHRTRYKAKHVVIWEQAHGPVPDGYVINLIDGDPRNWSLDNLEMVTRAEHCRLNKLGGRKIASELRPVAKTIAKIALRRGELRKRKRERETNHAGN